MNWEILQIKLNLRNHLADLILDQELITHLLLHPPIAMKLALILFQRMVVAVRRRKVATQEE